MENNALIRVTTEVSIKQNFACTDCSKCIYAWTHTHTHTRTHTHTLHAHTHTHTHTQRHTTYVGPEMARIPKSAMPSELVFMGWGAGMICTAQRINTTLIIHTDSHSLFTESMPLSSVIQTLTVFSLSPCHSRQSYRLSQSFHSVHATLISHTDSHSLFTQSMPLSSFTQSNTLSSIGQCHSHHSHSRTHSLQSANATLIIHTVEHTLSNRSMPLSSFQQHHRLFTELSLLLLHAV